MEAFTVIAIVILFALQLIILSRLDKVKQLERKVYNLEMAMRQLRQGESTRGAQAPEPQGSVQQAAAPVPQAAAPVPQAVAPTAQNPMPTPQAAAPAPQVSQQRPAAPQQRPAAPQKNFESKIGKTLMAVLASVLIFFSFILFAGVAFRYMSDEMKALIMLAVSVLIAAVGIVKMPRKDAPSNQRYATFFTALAACGIGAIYITALVAYFGFQCIDLIPFIVCIVIWLIVTMLLSYKRSSIFSYICNAGLIIATFLTAVQFETSLVAFILYTVCLMALYLMNRHSDFNKDCFYFLQYPIMFVVLSSLVKPDFIGFLVFAALVCGVFVLGNLFYVIEEKHIAINTVMILFNLLAMLRILLEEDNDRSAYLVIGIMLLFMAFYFVRYYFKQRALFYIMFVLSYGLAALALLSTDMHIALAFTPFIAFLLIGFVLKDVVFRVCGYAALGISFIIHLWFYESWFVLIIYAAMIVAAIVLMLIMDYRLLDKYIITALTIAYFIGLIVCKKPDICIRYAIFVVISIFMNTKLYHNHAKTGEREIFSVILGYIVNAIVLASGLLLIMMKSYTVELYQWSLIALMTLVVACVNVEKLFAVGPGEILTGLYLCIKFSMLINAVLYRLQTESFIVSIVGILIAITCIVLGFMRSHKSFRLYGLVVSLISVVKLILFDIQYDSYLLRPVGFFIAGVLCFAISFIYSKIEKNYGMSKPEDTAEFRGEKVTENQE